MGNQMPFHDDTQSGNKIKLLYGNLILFTIHFFFLLARSIENQLCKTMNSTLLEKQIFNMQVQSLFAIFITSPVQQANRELLIPFHNFFNSCGDLW